MRVAVAAVEGADLAPGQQALARRDQSAEINQAVAALPAEFREVIVLREVQDLSYKEIAAVIEESREEGPKGK